MVGLGINRSGGLCGSMPISIIDGGSLLAFRGSGSAADIPTSLHGVRVLGRPQRFIARSALKDLVKRAAGDTFRQARIGHFHPQGSKRRWSGCPWPGGRE